MVSVSFFIRLILLSKNFHPLKTFFLHKRKKDRPEDNLTNNLQLLFTVVTSVITLQVTIAEFD